MTVAGSKTTEIQRSALVPYSAKQMYSLVADVERYPEFLPWCRSVTVHRQDELHVEASMEVARGPLRKSFTTRNQMHPYDSIEIRLVRGPFKRLEGHWRFQSVDTHGSRVSLEMRFEMASGLLRRTLAPLFGEMANSMVDAFSRRARKVYGR